MIYFILIFQILTNNDFEEWDTLLTPVGWEILHPTALPVSRESDTVFSGLYSVKIERASPTTSLKEALQQWVNVNFPGYEYHFKIYIFDNDPDVYGWFSVSWYKVTATDTVYLFDYALSPKSQDADTWQILEAIDIAPDTAGLLKFTLKIYLDTLSVIDSIGYVIYDYSFATDIQEKINIRAERKKVFKKGIYDILGRKTKKGRILFIIDEKREKVIKIK